jgi:hypothetical protein
MRKLSATVCLLVSFGCASDALLLSSAVAAAAHPPFRLAAGAALSGASGARGDWPVTSVPLSTPALRISGDGPPRGIFDPSLASLPGGVEVLSYSAVWATDNISSRLAVYNASSSSWVLAAAVNVAAVNVSLPCAGGAPCQGSLIHEVSSVVAAPAGASGGAALRVFCHTYAVTGGDQLHYDWGHIAMYESPSPAGPWSGGPLLGWAGASPLSTAGVATVLTGIPELADCLLFTEPGAAADPAAPGRTLLALGCASLPAGAPAAAVRIVLLASGDAAAREWTFVSTLVDGATDAARLGFALPTLNAADLFAVPAPAGGADALFLIASPSAVIGPALSGYCGCLVLAVVDSGTGGVARNASGAPVVAREIAPGAPAFAGACTAAHADAAGQGFLLPVLESLGAFFTILPSGAPAGGGRAMNAAPP